MTPSHDNGKGPNMAREWKVVELNQAILKNLKSVKVDE